MNLWVIRASFFSGLIFLSSYSDQHFDQGAQSEIIGQRGAREEAETKVAMEALFTWMRLDSIEVEIVF